VEFTKTTVFSVRSNLGYDGTASLVAWWSRISRQNETNAVWTGVSLGNFCHARVLDLMIRKHRAAPPKAFTELEIFYYHLTELEVLIASSRVHFAPRAVLAARLRLRRLAEEISGNAGMPAKRN
jgi:hypothetical protein